jgi:hypothetical protein
MSLDQRQVVATFPVFEIERHLADATDAAAGHPVHRTVPHETVAVS